MQSTWAKLRNLVLPFGATSGTRIILDGVQGRISVFNGTAETIREDAATSTITAGDQTTGARIVIDGANSRILGYDSSNWLGAEFDAGSTEIRTTSPNGARAAMQVVGGQAQIGVYPQALAGVTWLYGTILAGYDPGPTNPYMSLYSPCVSGFPPTLSSHIKLTGGIAGNNTTAIDLQADAATFNGVKIGVTDTTVITTDAAGEAWIATGLTSVVSWHGGNGDRNATGLIIVSLVAVSGGSVQIRVERPNGTVVAGALVRVNWSASGR